MISMSVCLSVCLFVCSYVCMFVCLSACISRKTWSIFHQIFSTCCAWPWLGSPMTAVRCYLLPVLWMTSLFHIMMGTARIKNNACVSFSLPVGDTGTKCAVSDCILLSEFVTSWRLRQLSELCWCLLNAEITRRQHSQERHDSCRQYFFVRRDLVL